MLEELAGQTSLKVQSPIRNQDGDFVTIIEHEGKRLNCSMLTWLEGGDLDKKDVTERS
ncbi:hypothetical protein [Paenibacillus caui]|uniref:hypothetical protein n=1 Tax=Paenibacillus caui TaxID=2873927 RepID=UPI001F45EC0A|nr:hypothetical protein [Paenibacillus caui]